VLRAEVQVNEYCNTHRQTLYAYRNDLALLYVELHVVSKRLMRLSITQLPEFPESNVALARHTTYITKGVLQLINSSVEALPGVKEFFVLPFVTPVTHSRWPCMFSGVRVRPPSDERVPSFFLAHSGLG
jgi:hypothetical protein